MKTSKKGLALIKQFEGLRLKAYLCSGNVPTIGYGHTRGVKIGDTCTEAQADAWLIEDVRIAERCVNDVVTVPLTQNEFDALVSWTFNLGCGALRKSTMLQRLNAERFEEAAEEMVRWNKANGRAVAGLTRRREAERALFEAA